jgi:hypothetical protein
MKEKTMAGEDDDLELDDLHEDNLDEGEVQDEKPEGGQDDAASGQDEQQADGEAGSEGEVRPEAQPRQVSRGERRFQTLSNSVKDANERATKLERELREERAARQRREAQETRKEPTAEEMALWTTDQIVDYKLGKSQASFQQTLQQIQFQTMESSDQAAFSTLCATDPRAKKYAGEVEQRLADLRAQGQNVPRANLLRWIIGDKVMAGAGKQVQRQRQQGQDRIRRQQSLSTTPRSDAAGNRGAKTDAEKRLERIENITF